MTVDENFNVDQTVEAAPAPADVVAAVVPAAEPAPVVAPAPVAPVADPVNSPAHYTAGPIEVIDFIEQIVKLYPPEIGYHVGNALKYLARAPLKGELKQDLGKADWYVQRAVSRMG